ncbi:ABC-2 type transport system ATP-binding protein [Dysgonomonas alginatilytica]|uniref:ABC-2 type transport system ATP-binding protein n=1 Tax=Dysgonomonas alginatilytica TaxID=1605892 RepID=A0A2V3PPP7_9BACT|nr:ATP-binding cassette domain-containing protein [Dysgonomonas alginatilytica]PXV62853.1 ABC-2 type transport system ATP-binding protein [Dysgonomonas alginatilytica]
MIEVCNISKSYGKLEVLHDISFTLHKGEVAAFLGPNGAGKSTTMNIIAGVISATKGQVLINGEDIQENPQKIKQNIGYLPEYNPLYEDMYVREYLEYAARIYLPKSEIKQRVDKMIQTVNIESEYRKKIHSLSNGNKQRVGLAQALIHDPHILILDELSNGLDPNQHAKMMELIIDLGKSKIVLYSSHRFDDVSEIASHYLILNKGSLVFDGKADDVPSVKDLFYTYCK